MKIANIIITEHAIPYTGNGSWTQRIEYFLTTKENNINYFICGTTTKELNTTTRFFRVSQYKSRLIQKFFPKYRYKNYRNKLHQLSQEHDHLIVCVIDNVKLKIAVSDCIDQLNLKNKITVLFYNCGYSYFLNNEEHKLFLKNCDEIIYLTQNSYHFNKDKYHEFTPEVSVLANPIDKRIFHKITKQDKESLLEKHNLKGKIVFLWLAHDREKKGLSIILNAWKDWKQNEDVILLVVGANRNQKIDGVQFIGEVDKEKVDEYYKLSHIYLFPTLCKEGFGLSLAQAICCGCYAIAANNGGVSDFFTKQDGILIASPNIVSCWVESMKEAYSKIHSGWESKEADNQILNYQQWSSQFAKIFQKWEDRTNK